MGSPPTMDGMGWGVAVAVDDSISSFITICCSFRRVRLCEVLLDSMNGTTMVSSFNYWSHCKFGGTLVSSFAEYCKETVPTANSSSIMWSLFPKANGLSPFTPLSNLLSVSGLVRAQRALLVNIMNNGTVRIAAVSAISESSLC